MFRGGVSGVSAPPGAACGGVPPGGAASLTMSAPRLVAGSWRRAYFTTVGVGNQLSRRPVEALEPVTWEAEMRLITTFAVLSVAVMAFAADDPPDTPAA